jgi:hypothetical protein
MNVFPQQSANLKLSARTAARGVPTLVGQLDLLDTAILPVETPKIARYDHVTEKWKALML